MGQVPAELPLRNKREILEQKLALALGQIYSAEVDARVAEKTGDPQMRERAQKVMSEALRRKSAVEEILRELPEKNTDTRG